MIVTDDLVLFGTDSPAGRFYALDRASAVVRWDHPAGRGVFADPTLMDDHIVLMTLEDELVCLDLDTGTEHWRAPGSSSDDALENRTSPVPAGDHVIAGRPDGTLVSHVVATGRLAWRKLLGAEITATAPDGLGGVIVATAANELFRISSELGLVTARRYTDGTVNRPPLVTEQGIIVFYDWMVEGGEVISITSDLETVNWRHPAPEGTSWTIALAHPWRDVLLVGTQEGEIIALDPTTGAQRWSHWIEGPVRTIGHDDRTLYVGSVNGTLHALDTD